LELKSLICQHLRYLLHKIKPILSIGLSLLDRVEYGWFQFNDGGGLEIIWGEMLYGSTVLPFPTPDMSATEFFEKYMPLDVFTCIRAAADIRFVIVHSENFGKKLNCMRQLKKVLSQPIEDKIANWLSAIETSWNPETDDPALEQYEKEDEQAGSTGPDASMSTQETVS
jgi:hypothetical protein